VNCLESGLLVNDGEGRFSFRPLPRLAQIAPGFGASLTDINGDANLDLYMVQNALNWAPDTGHLDGGVSLLLAGRGDGTFTPVWPDRSGLVVGGDATALTVADLNGDPWPDFLVAVNDGPVQAFVNNGSWSSHLLRVRLEGPPGNPAGVGARVTVAGERGVARIAEVYAGGSYLSQSAPTLCFGLGPERTAEAVEVRWPDGEETALRPAPAGAVTLKHPSRSRAGPVLGSGARTRRPVPQSGAHEASRPDGGV
jgi:hypothetical protein